jgi:hypothetical protein
VSGKLRVWSWDNPEHLTKLELPVFAGEIKDLDWDFESKRIVAVGDGNPVVSVLLFSCAWSYNLLCRVPRFSHGIRAIVQEK